MLLWTFVCTFLIFLGVYEEGTCWPGDQAVLNLWKMRGFAVRAGAGEEPLTGNESATNLVSISLFNDTAKTLLVLLWNAATTAVQGCF